jgi:hypothetical protein
LTIERPSTRLFDAIRCRAQAVFVEIEQSVTLTFVTVLPPAVVKSMPRDVAPRIDARNPASLGSETRCPSPPEKRDPRS